MKQALGPELLRRGDAPVPGAHERVQPGRRRLGADPERVPAGRRPEARLTARLLIEYDGSRFAGWARQAGQRTVQGVMEEVLATVRGEPVELTVAGRTDAGVHALGQVASHAGEPLPLGRVERQPAAATCACSRASRRRTASTRAATPPRAPTPTGSTRATPLSPFERGRALHWPQPLDREALDACAALLPGKHDLTAFTRTQTEHVRFERNITAAEWVEPAEHVLEFRIEAPSFMRNQVRILVGTMLEVGRGSAPWRTSARLLEGRPRTEAGRDRAAARLYLVEGERTTANEGPADKRRRHPGHRPEPHAPRAARACPDIELAVIAPDSNRSATARSITTRRPLWVEEIEFGDGTDGLRHRRHARRLRPLRCARPRRVPARADRLGHQPRREPGRRHHLLRHRRRRARGRRARHPGDRRLAAVAQGRDGLPPRRPVRLRAGGGVRRARRRRAGRRPDPEGHAAERQLPARRRARARRSASSASGSTATSSTWPRRRATAGSTGSTATTRATTTRTAPTSPRSPTATSPSRRCTSTSRTSRASRSSATSTSTGCCSRRAEEV